MLTEVDQVSITLLMDNYTDRLLPLSYPAIRLPMIKDEVFLPPPIAEHGFSALIKVSCLDNKNKKIYKSKTMTVLFDFGVSENGVIYNASLLNINFGLLDFMVLSHGHLDHFAALPKILKIINKPIKLICHPDSFLKRWIVYPNSIDKARMPFLDKDLLERNGAILETREGPSLISKNSIKNYAFNNDHCSSINCVNDPELLITGQIPRNRSFEKGFPVQYKEEPDENNLVSDYLVNDDQSIIVNVKEKGLVIITGCAHSGIINTIDYAKKLTSINKVFAVVGGFHLTGGGMYENAIEPTITELKSMDPCYIIPCHCTGWKATNRIIQEFPLKFIQPSVCSTFTFEKD